MSFHGLPGGVDRRVFMPCDVWVRDGDAWVPLHRSDDEAAWEALVLSDHSVTTRVADGRPAAASSVPSMMATMIGKLGIRPGMKVLEIGTGTGYSAACLAALGADVVTVEIDEALAGRARRSLESAGYPGVRVITGDGAGGAPGDAPFDRVIATASVREVPYAWVRQTADGGVIVVPYTGTEHKGGLLVLHVSGGAASGEISDTAFFMPMTGHGFDPAEFRGLPHNPGLRVEVTSEGQATFLPPALPDQALALPFCGRAPEDMARRMQWR